MDFNGSVEQTDISQTQDSSPESTGSQQQQTSMSNNQQADVARVMAELDKMDRFKFDGQEWTPKDLKQAIMRQRDYTQKTQALSKDRESFDQERKFNENLYADLMIVKENPNLANDFLKMYPEKYHTFLKQVLGNTQQQGQQQSQTQTHSQQKPQVDIELLSRMNKLESVLTAQEVEKNTVTINKTVDDMSKKYPDAIPELALAKVFELYNQMMEQNPQGRVEITQQQWEKAFKDSHEKVNSLLKAKYGDLVKKQTTANKKAQDVDAGGGTVGGAPAKFGSLRDVTKFAEQDLAKRG